MKLHVWNWQYTGPRGSFDGSVQAGDARDALSRALTSEVRPGELLGDEHRVPIQLLQLAPGNDSLEFEAQVDGHRVKVERATSIH